jgi:hypothetical protein
MEENAISSINLYKVMDGVKNLGKKDPALSYPIGKGSRLKVQGARQKQ